MFDNTAIAPSLSDVEWKTVAIALADAFQPRRATQLEGGWSGKLCRLYVGVTGNRPLTTLPNPRLEALRGFVERTRRTGHIAEQFVPSLIAQGFSRPQVEAIALLAA